LEKSTGRSFLKFGNFNPLSADVEYTPHEGDWRLVRQNR